MSNIENSVKIAVDLGGTLVRAAIVNRKGEVFYRHQEKTVSQTGPKEIIQQIYSLVQKVLENSGTQRITGLGIACPGPLDEETGIVLNAPTLKGFVNFPFRDQLSEIFPWPIKIRNDAHCATLAEWQICKNKTVRNMVYLTVSTGIGGGIISDGQLVSGKHGLAGHFGHMILEKNGPRCVCGNNGCWEAFVSGTALNRQAKNVGFSSGQALFEAARQKDNLACKNVAIFSEYLGKGLVNIMHILSPELIVIGGGVAQEMETWLPQVKKTIDNSTVPFFPKAKICKAFLGVDSGLIGATL